MLKSYVLTAPLWETTSGGVRVMYGLYGWLLARGQVAYLNQLPTSGEVIAIYPEIQQGNPANAKSVVRYLLNTPGLIPALMSDGSLVKGPTEFPPTDKLIYFSKLFGDGETMFLPIIDLFTFKDQKKKRTKTAYFVGKGINYPELKMIHPDNAVLIDRELAQDQGALADLLNECHTLYCYDPVSAMLEIARLCGVRIIMVNPAYTKEEFKKYEPGMNGISWGKDEGISLDTQAFRETYQQLKKDFEVKLDQFIEETQNA